MTVGATFLLEWPDTSPMPWSMLRLTAPRTVQFRVVSIPAVMVGEAALKDVISGAGITLTVTWAVTL